MSYNIKQPLAGNIDIGLVKIEQNEMADINIVEKMELQWEHNQQTQNRPKP